MGLNFTGSYGGGLNFTNHSGGGFDCAHTGPFASGCD
jgi:hypothetical protein